MLPKFRLRIFWKILISHSRLSRFVWRIVVFCFPAPTCPTQIKSFCFPDFQDLQTIRCPITMWGCSLFFFNIVGSPKIQNSWFCESWTPPGHPEIMTVRILWLASRKVISPKWSRIILRSFWPYLPHKLIVNMTWTTTKSPKHFALLLPYLYQPGSDAGVGIGMWRGISLLSAI